MGSGSVLRGKSGYVALSSAIAGSNVSDIKVVGEKNACIDGHRKEALPTDHLKINKYEGPEDPSYKIVCPIIKEMTKNAMEKVQRRLDRMWL